MGEEKSSHIIAGHVNGDSQYPLKRESLRNKPWARLSAFKARQRSCWTRFLSQRSHRPNARLFLKTGLLTMQLKLKKSSFSLNF